MLRAHISAPTKTSHLFFLSTEVQSIIVQTTLPYGYNFVVNVDVAVVAALTRIATSIGVVGIAVIVGYCSGGKRNQRKQLENGRTVIA